MPSTQSRAALLLLAVSLCSPQAEAKQMEAYGSLTYEDIVTWECPESVDRQAALEDFEQFKHVLEDGYAAYDLYASKGHDWGATFSSLRADIEAKEAWAPLELAEKMAEALRFTNDMHTSFSLRDTGGRTRDVKVGTHMSPYFADILVKRLEDGRLEIIEGSEANKEGDRLFLEKCEGEPPDGFLFRTFAPGVGREVYLMGRLSADQMEVLAAEVRDESGKLRETVFPLHRGRMTGYRPDRRSAFHYGKEPFPILKVNTFYIAAASPKAKEELERFLSSAKWPEIRQSQHVLVDIRGNGGGVDQGHKPWLQELTDEPMQQCGFDSLVSPLVVQAMANNFLRRYVLQGEATKELYEAQREEALRQLEREAVDKRQWFTFQPQALEPTARSRFKGALLVLIDGGTASAAEDFIGLASQLERCVLLGENSSGTQFTGEVLPYMLPNSRILFWCGHNIFRGPAGEIREGTGYMPDYWFDVSDPMDAILDLRPEHLDALAPRRAEVP